MVAYFGMSDEVGNISFYDSSGQSEYGFTKPYSEKTAELIDSEAKKIVEESYLKAKEVISSNIAGLTQLAEQLLEKEVIFSEDLERIFGKRRGDKHAEAAAAEAATAGSSAGEGGVAGASATEAATAGSSAGESGVTGSQAREAEAPAAPATEVPGPGNGE